MPGFILGRKLDQYQLFNDQGERIPVTFIETDPCYLIDIKEPSRDGYFALKLGFGETKKIQKPVAGELKKAGVKPRLRFLREFRLEKYQERLNQSIEVIKEGERRGLQIGKIKVVIGDKITPLLFFKKKDFVIISATSKGKGFQGVVKRHRFGGGPRTHGQSDRERAPGSIGQTTTPGRVYKGKKMAGRMGGQRVTIKNIEVVEVTEKGLLVKGLLPGSKGGLIEVRGVV